MHTVRNQTTILIKNLIFVTGIILFITSCSTVYVPNARNSPLFKKGGEFQGSVHLGPIPSETAIDAQAAVSVTKHLALMGNFSYAEPDKDRTQDKYHKHKFGEGAIGYFTNYRKWCYEIFAGYGEGEGSGYDQVVLFNTTTEFKASGKFTRFFIQPSAGVNIKAMSIAFAPRISLVDFKEFRGDNTINTQAVENNPEIFIEPAVIGRFNFMKDRMFCSFQGGVCLRTSTVNYDYRRFNGFLGFGFRLGGTKRKETAY